MDADGSDGDASRVGQPPRSAHSNPLVQLELLRNFVGTAYTERQLTDSLKKCCYNVERAAEALLLTGGTSSLSSSSSSSSVPLVKGAVRYRSSVSNGPSSVKSRGARGHGPVRAEVNDKPAPMPSSIRKPSPTAPSSKSQPPPGDSTRTKDPPSRLGTDRRPAETIVIDDDSDDDDDDDDSHHKNNSANGKTSRSSAPVAAEPTDAPAFTTPPSRSLSQSAPPPDSFFLLCERWISDGFCTTPRAGRVAYRERLDLNAMGETCVRFRANLVEGRLPDGLARFLAPLLLEQPPPIRIEGRALMELDRLGLGAEVPMALKVFVNPVLLFRENELGTVDLGDLEDEAHKTRKKASLARSSCVFRLGQWAEHGEVLPFEAPPAKDEEPASNTSTSSEGTASASSAGSTSPAPAEEAAINELSEEDFEGDDVEGEEKDDSVSAPSEWARTLPEADEPRNWQNGVTLRPYQRQALHWMLERENGTSREEWEEQLALVAELSGVKSERSAMGSQSGDISCECGPVLVSDKAKAESRTVGGDVNPIKHPLWKQRYLATPDLKGTLCFFVNEVMQVVSPRAPPPPAPCSGGILADSMGLGKTVMLLALILKSKELIEAKQGRAEAERRTETSESSSTTLVVAKLSLLPQWEEEIKNKTSLSYAVYYGPQASKVSFSGVDIVITTYGTIQGELTRKNPPLLSHPFLRIVLDEAHCVKNHTTLASRVCCQLKARHRWCVSGTILQNSLDDVYGIMRFLRHEPWCHGAFWKKFVTKPAEKEEDGLRISLDRVRRLLSPLMLRRTKSSVTSDSDGEPILVLPPVEMKVVRVEMSDRERDFYNAVLARSMEVFDGFVREGTVQKSYFQIFSLIQRLRQICDHIALTVRSRMISDVPQADDSADSATATHDAIGKKFLDDLLSRFCSPTSNRKRSEAIETENTPKRQKENYLSQVANSVVEVVRTEATHMKEECPICLEHPKLEIAVLTPCAHIFCGPCLMGFMRKKCKEYSDLSRQDFPNGECPCCNKVIEGNRIIAVARSKSGIQVVPASSQPCGPVRAASDGALARQILREALQMESSSKLTAIFEELNSVWTEAPGSKVLIFSHYLGFLDLLESRLRRDGVPCFRLDGTLNLSKRANVLDDFRSCCTAASAGFASTPPRGKGLVNRGAVLLMSMSAGGEGLNLTAASTCFVCEPWWNSAKEDQCVSRINRIGQKALKIRVRKFVVAGSVEDRIVELQQRKAYMADEIYSEEGRQEGPVGGGSRLGLEDFRLLFQT